jgi:hypothetical protein
MARRRQKSLPELIEEARELRQQYENCLGSLAGAHIGLA